MPRVVSHTLDDPAAASQFIEVNFLISNAIGSLRALLPKMLCTYPLLNDITNLGCHYYTAAEQDEANENCEELKAEMEELHSLLRQLQHLLRDLRSVTRPRTELALRYHFLHIDSFLSALLKNLRDLIHAPNYSLAEEKVGQLHVLLNKTKYGL